MQIGLIGCTKSKLNHAALAGELYMPSSLFRKAKAYCEHHYERWYILSAKHGLLHPNTIIGPYDVTLKRMRRPERRAWGQRVSKQLQELGPHIFYAHAGKDYLEYLTGITIVNPLEGLGYGILWIDHHSYLPRSGVRW